jgi:anti-sigma factor RsiW
VLTCYRYRRRIGAWLDGALDDASARSTAAHVGTCRRCTADARALTRMKSLLVGLPAAPEPDWAGFWPGVVRGIQDARTPRREPRRFGWLRPRWAYGGAFAAALLVSTAVWKLTPPPSPVASESPVIVRSADTGDPDATVMVYSTPDRDLTVVWVMGLE